MKKIALLIITLLATTTVAFAQDQTINGMLTVNPGAKSSYTQGIRIYESNDKWSLVTLGATGTAGTAENSWIVGRSPSYNFVISRNSADGLNGMVITKAGNVGFGTATPQYKLHVEGDIYSKNWVRVNGNQGLYFQSWGGGFYMLDANWIRTYGNKGFYHNTGIMRTDGIFHVGPDGNRLIVNANGNVGIGTTNPRALLDIGNLSRNKLKSVLARSDEGNNDGEGTYLGVKTYNTQPVSGESYSNVKSFALEHKFYGQLNNSINFYRGSSYTGGSISLAVDNGKEIARFHSTGLNLAGTINARQVNITVSAGADHVFYPGYALKPLSEVESFVKENKHLPDIPSEKQMVENGLNVNEMQIKLLQKIEELTLYVIEQDKKIEKQNRIIQELQNQQDN